MPAFQKRSFVRPSLITLGALLAQLTGLAGCYPKAGPPPVAPTQGGVAWASKQWPGVTAATLAAGRETFLAKCNGCHDYPDISAIAEEDWPSIVERMGSKSDLDDEKTKGVLQYVLASRHP